ncbi:benzoate/H(+) symporter BenE family transporter [Vibrio lentus]|nr:benzoate/H(+) symporter BenE family transporter [Vibrio lentus]
MPEQLEECVMVFGVGNWHGRHHDTARSITKPVVTAWSTPRSGALLITSLEGLTMNQAVAVFFFSSLLITRWLAFSGNLEKVLKQIP